MSNSENLGEGRRRAGANPASLHQFYICPQTAPTNQILKYADCFVSFYAPSNSFRCDHRSEDAVATACAEVIYCDTCKLSEVVRKLHAKHAVAETVLDTARFHRVHTEPLLTVTQLAAHPKLESRDQCDRVVVHRFANDHHPIIAPASRLQPPDHG